MRKYNVALEFSEGTYLDLELKAEDSRSLLAYIYKEYGKDTHITSIFLVSNDKDKPPATAPTPTKTPPGPKPNKSKKETLSSEEAPQEKTV